jgi:DNA-binding response OmpR family regulator
MHRILVVEDNPDLAFGLRHNLEFEGYEVEVAADGPAGLAAARSFRPDLIVLDLMLPGLDGYRVLRTLRDEGSKVPVLILTARGEEADKVRGFRMGADDYVTKPFGLLELLARVEALLRRADRGSGRSAGAGVDGAPDGAAAVIAFGDIVIDPARRSVLRAGREVALAPKEFDLLVALYEREGRVASRHELMREVWGHRAAIVSRTVDTHIAELRRKLEADPGAPRHILTVHKVGYRLVA